ncbi:MAG: hypothetical protein M3063_04370 [Actinomycetota bacterium]|nr:hypothetical protein [Actinomycetota bacterium]
MGAQQTDPASVTGLRETDPVAVAPRRCGRCQHVFDDGTASVVQTDWALCPPCAEILLPPR